MGRADREKLHENHVRAGEIWNGGECKDCFQYRILVYRPLTWHTLWLVNCDSLLQTLTSIIRLCARRVYQTYRACETLLPRNLWHFDAKNGFSASGRGSERIEVFKKMLTRSPDFSLPAVFRSFANSLLSRSLFPLDREPRRGQL